MNAKYKEFLQRTGLYLGSAVLGVLIAGSGAEIFKYQQKMLQREVSRFAADISRRTELDRAYNPTSAAVLVYPGEHCKTNISVPIATYHLLDCAGLCIVDKKGREHGIFHVSRAKNEKDVKGWIMDSFDNLSSLEIYILQGMHGEKIDKDEGDYLRKTQLKTIYSALKELNIETRARYIAPSREVISETIKMLDGREAAIQTSRGSEIVLCSGCVFLPGRK